MAGKTKHGLRHLPEYRTWVELRRRCRDKKNHERRMNYVDRGIGFCERWDVFLNFLSDMGRKPSPKHSIDRIDNDAGYTPENCRWSSSKEQCNNRRSTIQITYKGLTKSLAEWGDELGYSRTHFHRLYRQFGMNMEEIENLSAKKNRTK